MIKLSNLKNESRGRKQVQRVGRGIGSNRGKTCSRGQKGAGARAGYKRRWGYEGGQMRLHMKTPTRGFSNAPFRREYEAVNLGQIDKFFKDGEVVSAETLKDRGLIRGNADGVKILGEGNLTKKVTFEVTAISSGAREKLQQAKIPFGK
jgi:large subunit ribosomal protein L15